MVAAVLNPLNELYALVPIVDEKGCPTPQFQRQWQDLLAHIADIEARLTAGGL
jgi:hypothetical protein